MSEPTTYRPSALPATLLSEEPRRCRYCPAQVVAGTTTKGKRAMFDALPPHPNHWITCERRDAARKDYPR